MRPERLWPAAIVALLLVPVIANGILIHRAGSDPSVAVEPDYYAKSMEWDALQERRRASAELGWSASVSAAPTPDAGLALAVTLVGRDGAPIDDASVSATAFAIVRSADRMSLPLEPRGGGLFVARLPRARAGLWEVQLEARRRADLFLHDARIEVGAPR